MKVVHFVALIAAMILICGCETRYDMEESPSDEGGPAGERRLPFLPNTTVTVSQGNDQADPASTHYRLGALAKAVDFTAGPGCEDRGVPIIAAAGGTVIEAVAGLADRSGTGTGNHVYVRYSDGRVGRYFHLRDVMVRRGQPVLEGQALGTMGTSGYSTACHLHYDEVADGSSQTLPLNFLESDGVPQEGRSYSSRNTGPYDRAYWSAGGPSMLGEPSEEARWYDSYARCADDDGDADLLCDNESAHRANIHILPFEGGLVGRAALVYDALRGAREAVIIHGRLYDWYMASHGPASPFIAPLNNEYVDSAGDTRQDGIGGYLSWDGANASFHAWPDDAAPGEIAGPSAWNRLASYAVVEAYNALGRETLAGEPVAQFGNPAELHLWSGYRYLVQDFNGGPHGWFVIFYDSENYAYGGANRAISVMDQFWGYYITHDGERHFGAPISAAYIDSASGKRRMDWESGFCLLAQGEAVEQGTMSAAPVPGYLPNASICQISGGTTPPEPEPHDPDNDVDGYTIAEGDCDDTNPLINPDAVEICDDGRDNDCVWGVDCDDPNCADDPHCATPPMPVDRLVVRYTAPAAFSGTIIYSDWSGYSAGGTLRAPWAERCRAASGSSLECELDQPAGTFAVFNIQYGSSWACANWPASTGGTISLTWRGISYSAIPEANGSGGCNFRVSLY
ncbi:MAG: peptidoglycan DD-metalloendopeptidase family protein [Patescibacteria group bacterium]|nr:peptidoglycan DD-metalloendopeptidase family protein [Patescibacteria group bacterium]